MNNFIYKTNSGKLTKQRETELRVVARDALRVSQKTPFTTILEMLDINEDRFYRFMEDFIDAEQKKMAMKIAKQMKKREQRIKDKNIKRQQKRVEQQTRVSKIKEILPESFVYNAPAGFIAWKEIMSNHMGENITMLHMDDTLTSIYMSHEYSIPINTDDVRQFCNKRWFGSYDWVEDSNYLNTGLSGKMVVLSAQNINQLDTTINQIFREGETNCLLTPIKKWICEKLDNTTTKKSKERYITLYNKVNKLLVQYPNGVPRENINEISNNLNITISIELPFQKEPYILERPIIKSLTTFKYMNTTYNHVDEIINITKDRIVCTHQELYTQMKECEANNISYYFTMNAKNISTLYASGEIYGLSNDYSSFINEYENKYNIHTWKIDAIKQPELTKFLDNSCHYNCCMDFKDALMEVVHIDQRACYKNFKKCNYFCGFLSKITDFRFTNKMQGVGIYQITNIKITNEKFKRYNDYMKFYVNFNSYPSPSLKFLDNVGTYDIIGGCWGITDNIDMDYVSEYGLTFMNKDNGVPFYSKYFGSCNSINYDKKYYLNGTNEIANVIHKNTESTVYRYNVNLTKIYNNLDNDTNALISVSTKKSHVFHLSHVTAFILDYAKLNIIEQLLEMPFENIVRVNSDGIYFNPWNIYSQNLNDVEHKPWVESERRIKFYSNYCQLKNNYVEKPSNQFNDITGKFKTYTNAEEFCSNTIYNNITYNFGKYRNFYLIELAIGGGGSGKTHHNLVDTGLINVMYIAPSWKLARNKQEEYGCNVGTHASLLMCDPTNPKFSYSNVLLIDEVSMLTNEEKEKIINFYVDWKLIFCGDIKYQLPYIPDKNKAQTEFSSDGFDNIMEFHSDYRATCDKLKELKKVIRDLIDTGIILTPDNLFNKLQKTTEIEKIYKIEDMILCRTNNQKDIYKEIFTGKNGNLEKYYITKTINRYCCGEIIITDKELPSECLPEIRHAFTIHSIQGETCHTKLLIHKDIMTLRMFYTAISRAKTYDQIYLIE